MSFHIQQQPYRNQLANLGETFLLLCLTIIVIIEPSSYDVDSFGDKTKSYITYGLISLAAGYCIFITLYVWLSYLIKRCRTRGYVQIDDLDKDSYDGRYKESMKRRISGGKRKGYGTLGWLSPASGIKKSHSDNIVGHRRVPSPFPQTRSELHDKI